MKAAPLGRSVSPTTVTLWSVAVAITAIAALTLFGWMWDRPGLAAWKSGTPAMAPSTAVASLLFSASVMLAAPPSRHFRHAATLFAGTGLLGALALTVLLLLGVFWPAELLGLGLRGFAGDPTSGQISPITAFCFVLANTSLLITLSPLGRRGLARWLARSLGSLIALTGFLLIAVAVFGSPLLAPEQVMRVALNTSLILVLVGLAPVVLAADPAIGPTTALWRSRRVYVAVFAGIAAIGFIGGYAYYRQEERQVRDQTLRELDLASLSKAATIAQWREDRLTDGRVILNESALAITAGQFLNGHDAGALTARLRARVPEGQSRAGHYDRAFLIDAGGRTRLVFPNTAAPPAQDIARGAARVIGGGGLTLLDFYLDETDGRQHLALLVPIPDPATGRQPLGVLVLRIDPAHFLFPYLALWPGLHRTARCELVRRDGADALVLTEPRRAIDSTPPRRVALTGTGVLAVQAVLGQTGAAEGVDAHGVPVLGVLRQIPASPWYLVTQVERTEFSEELWQHLLLVGAFASLLLFATYLAILLASRVLRARFYRTQAMLSTALRESEERLRLAVAAA
ncbi:MAG: multi-sensor signal transduction histidine kinase, partial [bacterium]